jgi:hypothetical protein
MGRFNSYKGGGYAVSLTRTLNQSLTILSELKVSEINMREKKSGKILERKSDF